LWTRTAYCPRHIEPRLFVGAFHCAIANPGSVMSLAVAAQHPDGQR
jgi:hypothetical protein